MTTRTISESKKQLRQQLRLQRQELSQAETELASRQLWKQYFKHFSDAGYQKIALYLQHDNEVGTSELIQQLLEKNCQIYLPKIDSDLNFRDLNNMHFCRYDLQTKMRDNRYGIAEPDTDESIETGQLDLIFLPLTGFDLKGNRLGMGGGYYDRVLSKLGGNQPVIAGLAYDFQQIDECPVESFDQPMKMLITPTRMIDFNT